MPRIMPNISRTIRNFARDTQGTMSVEAVLILPVLVWAFIAFTVMWDAYRVKNLAQRATYTVADIISRERSQIRRVFITNYLRVFRYATEASGNLNSTNLTTTPQVLRVTSVMFSEGANNEDGDDGDDVISVAWSKSTDAARLPEWTNATIDQIKDKIPAMLDGDNIVVVETRLRWEPKFTAQMASSLMGGGVSTWMQSRDINTFTTVRPRFVPKVCYSDTVLVNGVSVTTNIPCEL